MVFSLVMCGRSLVDNVSGVIIVFNHENLIEIDTIQTQTGRLSIFMLHWNKLLRELVIDRMPLKLFGLKLFACMIGLCCNIVFS